MNVMKNAARQQTIHSHRFLDSSSARFSCTLAKHSLKIGASSVAFAASVQYTSSEQKRIFYYCCYSEFSIGIKQNHLPGRINGQSKVSFNSMCLRSK